VIEGKVLTNDELLDAVRVHRDRRNRSQDRQGPGGCSARRCAARRAQAASCGTFTGLKPSRAARLIQTLYIDFSEQDLVSLQSDLLPRSPEVALRTATFVKALGSAGHSSADVTNLLRGSKTAKDATSAWLPPKLSEWGNEPTFAPLSTGAGQYPTIGRAAMFAFMERYGAEALLRDFRRPIERIVGSIGQLEEYTGAAGSRSVVFLVGCSSRRHRRRPVLDVMRLIAHGVDAARRDPVRDRADDPAAERVR
jgi:hypothetical protein